MAAKDDKTVHLVYVREGDSGAPQILDRIHFTKDKAKKYILDQMKKRKEALLQREKDLKEDKVREYKEDEDGFSLWWETRLGSSRMEVNYEIDEQKLHP